MRGALRLAGVCGALCALVSGCLSRPVVETEPHASNLFVSQIKNTVVDKLDLLFMIDNSRSMADKQALLAQAVPELVKRLVVPRCVSKAGDTQARASLNEACPAGMAPEFPAVRDIHVAVITSSLGAHGASSSSCGSRAETDDHARLLPSVREGLTSYNGTGFLAWDPDQRLKPAGERDAARLSEQFSQMVTKAGEVGCGYEASLEAWYRFLIDPEPPLAVAVENGQSVTQGIDQEVLAQRRAFLRPDSLVAIVMLTDENDCSIRDEGYGYMLANGSERVRLIRARAVCDRDPNDKCCLPCSAGERDGCPPLAADPACKLGDTLEPAADPTNLRCLENKRRFGYDFLYDTSRYVDALTKTEVLQRSTRSMVRNPLYEAPLGVTVRDPSLVFLAGIVGVPWQDIADDASRVGGGLRYLTAAELAERGRWDVVVGDPSKNLPPGDPFMRESVTPRTGTNPVTGDAVMPPTSLDPNASPINGHEQNNVSGDDLQYACTFRLPETQTCDDDSCDCASGDDPVGRNRPLCQPPGGGPAGTAQYFGKAYPGLRTLEVLRGIGDSAIVASICPKVLEPGRPGYGYEPAVDAIISKFTDAFNARCLPRPLAATPESGGRLPCVVVEATPSAGACSCDAARRHAASPEASQLVRAQLKQLKNCGTSTTASCDTFCLCELSQAEGAGLEQCLNDEQGSDTPGYCYIDPFSDDPHGNPALVARCDSTSRQLLRFVGPDTPRSGSTAFIACLGSTAN